MSRICSSWSHLVHDVVRALHFSFVGVCTPRARGPVSVPFRKLWPGLHRDCVASLQLAHPPIFLFEDACSKFLSMLLSLCSCLSSMAACSIILKNSDYLLALSLKPLFHVFVFSASISAEISICLAVLTSASCRQCDWVLLYHSFLGPSLLPSGHGTFQNRTLLFRS